MKAVILCGGMGTRMKEETEFKPKPLVRIGGKPILHHIMNIYGHFGFNEFILCLGYKGEMIKEYFLNYLYMNNDFTLSTSNKKKITVHPTSPPHEDWEVTLADTGPKTNTGGRIKKIEKYVGEGPFFAAYGDSLGDVDLGMLLSHHKNTSASATLTGVHPLSRYGVIDAGDDSMVRGFREKPRLDGWINAGFFVFENEVFDYLDESSVLEKEPLENLAKDRKLSVYRHNGFWKCMDTHKDQQLLNKLWESKAPWKAWP